MQVEKTHHIETGNCDEDGDYDYCYEYDIYRFVEQDMALIARSYANTPQEAYFLRIESNEHIGMLDQKILNSELLQNAISYLQKEGKTKLLWLDSGSAEGCYSPLDI